MNNKMRLALGIATLAVTTVAAIPAHAECFLRVDGIKGESTDAKHAGEIAVTSWSWGVTQTGSSHIGSGGGAGTADVFDLKIAKDIDHTTPALTRLSYTGAPVKGVVLSCRTSGKSADSIVIALSGTVMVSSDKYGMDRERINEEVTFHFSTAQITHYIVTPNGATDPATAIVKQGS